MGRSKRRKHEEHTYYHDMLVTLHDWCEKEKKIFTLEMIDALRKHFKRKGIPFTPPAVRIDMKQEPDGYDQK